MLTKLKVQNLHERLTCYFDNNKSQTNKALFDMVMNTIIENVDFDVSKLSRALEMLDRMKENNDSTEYKHFNNMFDVSTQASKTYVKGFLSKGFPMLYFYRQGEDLPFFKIKSLADDSGKNMIRIETASSAEALSEYKNGSIEQDSFYVKVIDIKNEKDGYSYNTSTRAKAGKEDPFVMPKDNFPDEYKLFYSFLQGALESNGYDAPDTMGAAKFDFIFLELYEKIKKCVGDVKDFTMADLMLLMNATINSQPLNAVGFVDDGTMQINENSFVARAIAELDYDENNRKNKFYSKDLSTKDYYEFSTVQAINYLSVDIMKNGSPYSSYMMGKTHNGFTLFKSNRGADKSKGNDFAMLTFNLTDNMFKFAASYDETSHSKSNEEIIMKIMPDGELALSSDIKRFKTKKQPDIVRQVAMM